MAIKVIKKTPSVSPQEAALLHTVSNDSIIAPRMMMFRGRSLNTTVFELTSPIKPSINIKINAYGKPNVSNIDMGVQYEHYST